MKNSTRIEPNDQSSKAVDISDILTLMELPIKWKVKIPDKVNKIESDRNKIWT